VNALRLLVLSLFLLNPPTAVAQELQLRVQVTAERLDPVPFEQQRGLLKVRRLDSKQTRSETTRKNLLSLSD
jgi:hypothetical protein